MYMKEAVWAFSIHQPHYPDDGLTYYYYQPYLANTFFLVVWAVIIKILYKKKYFYPILWSFIFGGIFTLFYNQWMTFPYGVSLSKDTKNIVLTYIKNTPYQVLYKSPWDSIMKKNKNLGVLIKRENYDKLKNNGGIKSIDLPKLVLEEKMAGVKSGDQGEAERIWRPFAELGQVSYQLMLLMFSVLILVAKLNKNLFEDTFPWVLIGAFFTLIQAIGIFWPQNIRNNIIIYMIKRQLFIMGLGFCLTSILMILFYNKQR